MSKNQYLYIVGAGASKDMIPTMPTGEELIKMLKNIMLYTKYYIVFFAFEYALEIFIYPSQKRQLPNLLYQFIYENHYQDKSVNIKSIINFFEHLISKEIILEGERESFNKNLGQIIDIIKWYGIFSRNDRKEEKLKTYFTNSLKLNTIKDVNKVFACLDLCYEASDILRNSDEKTISIDHFINNNQNIIKEDVLNFIVQKIEDLIMLQSENIVYTTNEKYINAIISKHLIDNTISQIKFINFNYDNTIRDGINLCGNIYYTNDKKQNILEELKHKAEESKMYGSIESDTIELDDIVNSIGWKKDFFFDIRDPEYIKISLIRNKKSEEIQKEFSKIKDSNKIYFLGFGFDSWNLMNIGIYNENFNVRDEAKKLKDKDIYITNYGDLPKIRQIAEKIFGVRLYKESEHETVDDNGKIKKYPFYRSEGGGRNNVYISTKGVYRALTEDFD